MPFLRGPLRPQQFFVPKSYPQAAPFVPSYFIVGITRDEAGAILGGAGVKLFRTADDVLLQTTTSDPVTGQYAFALDNTTQCYIVSKAGGYGRGLYGVAVFGVDVAGVTVDSLVAV